MSYFYFSIMRPVGVGTYPRKFIMFHNYDKRTYIPTINKEAWGVLEYDERLTEREVQDYGFVQADLEWVGCYKDNYVKDFWDNPKYGDDNSMDILVPTEWVKANIGLTGYDTYEQFCSEYTYDETDALYAKANDDCMIYGRNFT